MTNINTCYKCNTPIRNWISLCNNCRSKRNNTAAILSTSKKWLIKLLWKKSVDIEWLNKFNHYAEIINSKANIILSYKKLKDNYITTL